MSASRRQAPLSTVLAANANSISALARQASSRLDETRFAPLRRARDKSARSKHACSARAPTRFALWRWAPVKSAPLSKARSILIPRRLSPEKSRPVRSADEKFARSQRAKQRKGWFGPKGRPFRRRVIAVCRSLTSSSAPIAVRRRRPYRKISIPNAGYERPICQSRARWESQGYCTADRLAGWSMDLAPLPLPVSLAQLALDNLARRVARQTVNEVDRLGQFVPGDALAGIGNDLGRIALMPRL